MDLLGRLGTPHYTKAAAAFYTVLLSVVPSGVPQGRYNARDTTHRTRISISSDEMYWARLCLPDRPEVCAFGAPCIFGKAPKNGVWGKEGGGGGGQTVTWLRLVFPILVWPVRKTIRENAFPKVVADGTFCTFRSFAGFT